MPSVTVMLSLGILFVSFVFGLGVYYVIDNEPKKIKKKRLDDVLSWLIQFIIYLWLAKIVVQLPKVLHDPIAVLAYPSNSIHFYVATALLFIHIAYKNRKQKTSITPLFETFSLVLVAALFMFEFLQIVTQEHTHLNFYFICLLAFLTVYVLFYQKWGKSKGANIISSLWILLASVLAFKNGYFMFFNFILAPMYFVVLGLLLLYGIYSQTKES